jgi:putative exporter of polyketide antibiotics
MVALITLAIAMAPQPDPQSKLPPLFATGMFVVVGSILVLPSLIAALGLLRRKRWAWHVLLAQAVLIIWLFPLGTAVACFGIWGFLTRNPAEMDISQPAPSETLIPSAELT